MASRLPVTKQEVKRRRKITLENPLRYRVDKYSK